jgi:hypothetical protein
VAGTRSIASAALLAAALFAGCGGGDTTTVISETTTTVASPDTTTDSSSTTSTTTTASTTPNSGGAGAADSLSAFQSPTGNIACVMTQRFARCDIAERDWSPPPHPSSCPDQVDYGQGIQLPANGAADFVCAGDTTLNPQAPNLAYGGSSRVGAIICTSTESGITCQNESGGGFTISRQSFDLN